MDLGIAGRRAFIAGSSSGMGADIAQKLAGEGVDIIVHGRNAEYAAGTIAKIRHSGRTATAVLGELGDPREVERVARDALATGPIDILINCQGSTQAPHSWFESSVESWMRQYQLVALYGVQFIQAFAPGMRERGWGRILNLSSVAAVKALTRHPDYSAAKLALHSITATLVQELGNSGVTCNILMSGLYESEALLKSFRQIGAEQGVSADAPDLVPQVLRIIGSRIPLERGGTAEELAATACFLVSEPAGFINGATIRVDGGNTGSVSI